MTNSKLIFLLTLFSLCSFGTSYSKDIGLVEGLTGSVLNKTDNAELIELDTIVLSKEYQLNPNSTLTISLDDGTVFVFSESAVFQFKEYEDIFSSSPHFTLKLSKGEFTVETGELPKLAFNATQIKSPSGILTLNGTAVSGSFGTTGQNEIFLLTDSFGNKGELLLTTESGETISVEPDAGVSISENGIEPQPVSQELSLKMEEMKNTIVETAIVDDAKIETMIANKIAKGKIEDLNGDGIIDDKDTELLKNNLLNKKEAKLNAIVQQTGNDASLLTKIIEKVPEDKAGAVLEKVIAENPKATSSVVSGVLENNSEKFAALTSSNKSLSDKIINTVIEEADENDSALSNIIAKADSSLSSDLLKNVSEKKSELLIKVVSEASSADPGKFSNLLAENTDLNSQVTSKMTEKILEDPDASTKLKDLIVKGNSQISSLIVESVEKVNPKMSEEAFSSALEENREEMVSKLAESINDNSTLANKIIAESIKQGDQSLIQESSIILTQNSSSTLSEENIESDQAQSAGVTLEDNQVENTAAEDPLNKLSEKINESVIELQNSNPEVLNNNIIADLQENLVSPN